MEHELASRGAAPQILLSGGAAEMIQDHLGRPARMVSNLVLEGLCVIAQVEGGC
jgi:pantothenate kinase type III